MMNTFVKQLEGLMGRRRFRIDGEEHTFRTRVELDCELFTRGIRMVDVGEESDPLLSPPWGKTIHSTRNIRDGRLAAVKIHAE